MKKLITILFVLAYLSGFGQHAMFYNGDEVALDYPKYRSSAANYVTEAVPNKSVIVAAPSGVLTDDILFGVVIQDGSDGFTTPEGWTKIYLYQYHSDLSWALYYKRATNDGAANNSATFRSYTVNTGKVLSAKILAYEGAKEIGTPYNLLNDELFIGGEYSIAPWLDTDYIQSLVIIFAMVSPGQLVNYNTTDFKQGGTIITSNINTSLTIYNESAVPAQSPLAGINWATSGVSTAYILELLKQ